MWLIYFLVIFTAGWVTTTWAGGGGQFQWQDTTMYLYSDGLCGRRFPGELMLYVPSLSDPHLLSIDSLRETHCIVESPDGRIFADGRKQGIGVIYVSEDGGYTWSETAPLTNTLSVNCISSSFPFSLDPMDTDSPGREIRGTYIGRRLPKTGTM